MGEPVSILDLAAEHDPPLRQGARAETSRSSSSAPRPGEKLHEELWTADDHVTPSGHPAIMQLDRPPIDSAWLESELQELERLVEGGETLELVGRLAAIARAPHRLGVPAVVAPAATATTVSKPA